MKKFVAVVQAICLAVLLLVGVREATQLVRAGVSCSVPNTFSNGTTADATQVNANFAALVACFANSAASGANSDITSLTGLTTPLTGAQGGTQYFWSGTSTGTANAQTITTVTPTAGFTKSAGQGVCFVPGATNTGATQINVNGTGLANLTRSIQLSTGVSVVSSLVGGELLSGNSLVCALFLGSSYTLVNRGVDYVGEIKSFAYAGCPAGWQEVTGANVSSTNFPDVFTLVGTTWGTSAGNTVMPDLRGAATYSRDGTGTRFTVAGSGVDGSVVGNTVFRQTNTLTQAMLPNVTNLTGTFAATNNSGHIPVSATTWIDTLMNTGSTVHTASTSAAGAVSDSVFTPTGSVTGISLGGSASPFTIMANAGIVTKCVKL